MKRPALIIVLLFIIAGPVYGRNEEPPGPAAGEELQARIDRLIARLGAVDWDTREEALRGLVRIGAPAVPALEKAAKGEDLEIRMRAADILWKIKMSRGSGFFSCRGGAHSDVVNFGGSKKTEKAVLMGLNWLRDHQSPGGTWSCKGFMKNCMKGACTGAGGSDDHDFGVTGLAMLAFTGAGHTYKRGFFKNTVKKILLALRDGQDQEGRFGPKTRDGRWIYNHAICTLAVAEAYAMSGKSSLLHGMTKKAVDHLAECQGWDRKRKVDIGWRYGKTPKDADTSCTAWALVALKAAGIGGFHVPQNRLDAALRWLDEMTGETAFRTGYLAKGDPGFRPVEGVERFKPGEAMTSAALLSRILLLERKAAMLPAVRGGGKLLLKSPPKWDEKGGTIDMVYWFWGTQAAFQLGKGTWKAWNDSMKTALVPSQRLGGCETGSWDPVGVWGAAGGRVYSTAINVLTLETYYRYPRFLE